MKEQPKIGTGLPLRVNLGYGIGDLAFNILINMTSLYLLFFYTDVFGITAAAAGIIFLISKIWNAAIDPLIGYSIDRTNTRWGKMRPYMLFGAIPLAVCYYLVFFNPDLPSGSKFLYGLVTFLIFNSVFAFVNVPYAALTATITGDTEERSKLTGFRMGFAIVGTLTAAVATKPIVSLFSSEPIGFRGTAAIFGAVATLIIIFSFTQIKETHKEEKKEEKDFRKNLKAMGQNKPFIFLVLGYFFSGVGIYTTALTVNYFFKYNLSNEKLISAAFGALFIVALLTIPLWIKFAKKFGKRISFISGLLIFIVSLIAIFFMEDVTAPKLLSLLAVAGVGFSTFFVFPWSMVADTVEYSHWKSNILQQGFLYGFFVFGLKLAQAFSGFLVGNVLDASGYVSPEGTGTVVQTPEALMGIKMALTVIPAGLMVIGIFFLWFYSIDTETHRRMVDEINQRTE